MGRLIDRLTLDKGLAGQYHQPITLNPP